MAATAILLAGLNGPSWSACVGTDLFAHMRRDAPGSLARIEAEAKASPFSQGVFFRIEHEGSPASFLFGTLHVADPRVARLGPEIREALAGSKTLLLETTDPSAFSGKAESNDTQSALKRALVASPDRRAGKLLTKEEFARLLRAAKDSGLPPDTLARLKPEVLALLLATPKCGLATGTAQPFIDMLLAEAAKKVGLRIVGLETLTEQIEVLGGIPEADDRQLLLSTIVQSEHGEDIVETSIARYFEGKTGDLVAWMRSDSVVPGQPQSQTPQAFLDRLLSLRNRAMLRAALPYLRKGEVFLAVGAAHLPGTDGLANLLVREGFRVTKIR